MYLQTPGFILKHSDWREVDRVYTIYTQKAGKLDIQARGVRKIGSKLRGHMQPFALVDLHLVRGKYRYQLIGADLTKRYPLPVTGYSTGYGFYILELVNKITREEQRNDQVFELLKKGLETLRQAQGDSVEGLKKLRLAFLLKLLKIKGYDPAKRVVRRPEIQSALEYYLAESFESIMKNSSNGATKTLFNISQYTLNEVIERPLKTVRFLQSL
jgi:DNA repair protein RecO